MNIKSLQSTVIQRGRWGDRYYHQQSVMQQGMWLPPLSGLFQVVLFQVVRCFKLLQLLLHVVTVVVSTCPLFQVVRCFKLSIVSTCYGPSSSALACHMHSEHHEVDKENIEILGTDRIDKRRIVKESIAILKHQHNLVSRNQCSTKISPFWKPVI